MCVRSKFGVPVTKIKTTEIYLYQIQIYRHRYEIRRQKLFEFKVTIEPKEMYSESLRKQRA